MNGLKGFQGFAPLGGAFEAPDELPAGQGSAVFQQMVQQMQASLAARDQAKKSQVDMLWPMGTVFQGKKQ